MFLNFSNIYILLKKKLHFLEIYLFSFLIKCPIDKNILIYINCNIFILFLILTSYKTEVNSKIKVWNFVEHITKKFIFCKKIIKNKY